MSKAKPTPQNLPDQFEVFNEVIRRGRMSVVREILAYVVALLALFMWFLAANKPVPVIIWGQNAKRPAQVVHADKAEVRDIDARRFFNRMLGDLHGWSSADIIQRFGKARVLMTANWRSHFEQEMNKQIEVPKEMSPTGKATVLSTYIQKAVRNDVDVEWDTLACRRDETAHWHCKARIYIEPQPLLGTPVDPAVVRREYLVKASFFEVPVTEATLDGLLVSFWNTREAD